MIYGLDASQRVLDTTTRGSEYLMKRFNQNHVPSRIWYKLTLSLAGILYIASLVSQKKV